MLKMWVMTSGFSPRVARPELALRRGATPATPSAFTQPNRVNYTMADTFTSLHYHVVFSTKGREPRPRLDTQED